MLATKNIAARQQEHAQAPLAVLAQHQLHVRAGVVFTVNGRGALGATTDRAGLVRPQRFKPTRFLRRLCLLADGGKARRSEEHTSELQSLMRISYAVFCLKKNKNTRNKPEIARTQIYN